MNSKEYKKQNPGSKINDVNLFFERKQEISDLNENNKSEIIQEERNAIVNDFLKNYDLSLKSFRIDYISDIHISHKLKNCKTLDDVEQVVNDIVNNLNFSYGSIILIAGDVSSNFEVFKIFIKIIRNKTSRPVIFVLGNHELYNFPNMTFEEIVQMYREFLSEYNMYLLQNDLLCICNLFLNSNGFKLIPYETLNSKSIDELSDMTRDANLLILGGIGFSGYNEKFNSNNGVYFDGEQNLFNRDEEIKETKKFESIYNKLKPLFINKNSIVLTHMPKPDWDKNSSEYLENVVYISGHNHNNFYYDDGSTRIYCDNQIGYGNRPIKLKTLFINKTYDYFADYKDGIYEITAEQYVEFYRAKNLRMDFNRNNYNIYMLKKAGYYCFLHKNNKGDILIFNGGSVKNTSCPSIEYCYENMDKMINKIEEPLNIYSQYQNEIANTIKKIGGIGRIHGSIIDIDFFNHIYLNPIDMKSTPYYATDIFNKFPFDSLSDLLETNLPNMYLEYTKLIKLGEVKDIIPYPDNSQGKKLNKNHIYENTDIYALSNIIKKMQKLESNVLSFWEEELIKEHNLKLK